MKKLSYILSIILSCFIFYSGYRAFSLDQIRRLDLFAESISEQQSVDCIAVNMIFENNPANKKRLAEEVQSYLSDNLLYGKVSISQNNDLFLRKVVHYLYSPSSFLDGTISLKTKKSIDFLNSTNEYYSTVKNDSNAFNTIDYLDSKLYESYSDIFEVHPLKDIAFDDFPSDMITLYIFGDGEVIMNSLNNSKLTPYLSDNEVEIYKYEAIQPELSVMVFSCTILALLLVSISILLKNRKEIMISKLFGHSNLNIFKNLYAKQYIGLAGIYCLVSVILYAIIIGHLRETSTLFIRYLLVFATLFLISILLLSLISFAGVSFLRSNVFLKQAKTKENKTVLSLIVKACLLTIIFVPSVTNFMEAFYSFNSYMELKNNEDVMTKAIMLNGVSFEQDTDVFEQQDIIQQLYEYIDEHKGYYEYFNFVELYQNTIGQENNLPYSIDYPYIIVNNHYLKDYQIYDTNGNLIPHNLFEESVLLVPDSYELSDEQLAFFSQGVPCKTLSIDTGNTFVSHNPNGYNQDTLIKKNPIILVNQEWKNSTSFSANNYFLPMENENDLKEFKQFLSEKGLSKIMNFHLNKAYYDSNVSALKYQIITSGFYTLLMVFIIFIYQAYSTIMYIHERKFTMVLDYTMGKSFFERYGQYILTNSLIYLVIIAWGLVISSTTIYSLCFGLGMLFIDDFIIFYTLKQYEKKEAVNVLKGE